MEETQKLTKAMREMLQMMGGETDFHLSGFIARGEGQMLKRAIERGLVAPTSDKSEWYRITLKGLAAL